MCVFILHVDRNEIMGAVCIQVMAYAVSNGFAQTHRVHGKKKTTSTEAYCSAK